MESTRQTTARYEKYNIQINKKKGGQQVIATNKQQNKSVYNNSLIISYIEIKTKSCLIIKH